MRLAHGGYGTKHTGTQWDGSIQSGRRVTPVLPSSFFPVWRPRRASGRYFLRVDPAQRAAAWSVPGFLYSSFSCPTASDYCGNRRSGVRPPGGRGADLMADPPPCRFRRSQRDSSPAGRHRNRSQGVLATILGALTLMFGASAVMIELRDALNTVWEVRAPQRKALQSCNESCPGTALFICPGARRSAFFAGFARHQRLDYGFGHVLRSTPARRGAASAPGGRTWLPSSSSPDSLPRFTRLCPTCASNGGMSCREHR